MLFVGTSIIHPSTEGVFLLCNILDLLIYSYVKNWDKLTKKQKKKLKNNGYYQNRSLAQAAAKKIAEKKAKEEAQKKKADFSANWTIEEIECKGYIYQKGGVNKSVKKYERGNTTSISNTFSNVPKYGKIELFKECNDSYSNEYDLTGAKYEVHKGDSYDTGSTKTQKNYLKKQEVKFKQYFTKQEKNLLLSLSKDQTELSEDSKKTFQSLRKKLPEKAEKALLSGKMDAFEIYQNIFKILEKAKIQVIYYEKYIEDKIARETKELKNQQIELENKLQRLEREEKRIQVELDSRLFALTRQFTEKSVSKIHRKNFIGGGAVQLLEEILPEFMEKPFKKLDKKEKEYIYQYIRQNIVSFKTRLGRYLNTQERRKIDMGKTIQAACKTGGIPFEVCFAKSKRNRSNLILILDISGSCKVASEMMLGFMYLLKDVFAGGCRVYVFVNSLYDVTEIMETDSIDKAVQSVLQVVPAKGVYSDYNRPLEMLWEKNRKYLKKDSFILFLGDYRNNKNPSGTEWMKNIHARAKKMFFLNTEQAAKWNQGDSIASVYAAFAPMYEIQTPADLIRFISQIR